MKIVVSINDLPSNRIGSITKETFEGYPSNFREWSHWEKKEDLYFFGAMLRKTKYENYYVTNK